MNPITQFQRDLLINDEFHRRFPTTPGSLLFAILILMAMVGGVIWLVSHNSAVQQKEAKAQEALDKWIAAVNKSGNTAGRKAAKDDGMSGKSYENEDDLRGLANYKKSKNYPRKATSKERLEAAQVSFKEGFREGYLSELTFSIEPASPSATEESPRINPSGDGKGIVPEEISRAVTEKTPSFYHYNAGYSVGKAQAEADENAGSNGPDGTRDEQVIQKYRADRTAYARLPGYPTSTDSTESLSQCQEKFESGFNDGFRDVCTKKRRQNMKSSFQRE